MRTIKFKGKSVDSSEWIEGYYYKECDNTYIIEDRQKDSMLNRNEAVLIDPDTVCQFTGFLDKNGKEIYEGDVLRSDKEPSGIFPLDKDPHMAVVCWSEEHGVFYKMTFKGPEARVFQNPNRSCHVLSRYIRNYEVIGNIHDSEWKQKFGGRTERELSIEIFDND